MSPSEIFQFSLQLIPVLILVYISYTPLFRQEVSSFTGLATKILCALHVPTTRAAWPGRLIILGVISLTGFFFLCPLISRVQDVLEADVLAGWEFNL